MSRPNTRDNNKRPCADESNSPSVAVFKSIDNGLILCEHGKVPTSKLTSMKRLSAVAWLKLFSKVCEECIGERESCALVEKLNYHNEDIHIYLVHGKEVPKSIKDASKDVPVSYCRISKRSRRTSSGNSISLKVFGSTSVYLLKLMIWESLEIANKSVFPGDVLWVRDSESFKNRDIADEISEQKGDILHVEEGFRGTLLTSSVSAQLYQDT